MYDQASYFSGKCKISGFHILIFFLNFRQLGPETLNILHKMTRLQRQVYHAWKNLVSMIPEFIVNILFFEFRLVLFSTRLKGDDFTITFDILTALLGEK